MKLIKVLSIGILLVGCSKVETHGSRKIASTDELYSDINRVMREVTDPTVFNAETCAAYAKKVNDYLITSGAETYLPKTSKDAETLDQSGADFANTIFHLRLKIRDRLSEFYQEGKVSEECVDSLRRSLRYARNMEEVITEWVVNRTKTGIGTKDHEDRAMHLYLNPKFSSPELRSGDVLLVRGESFVSATIARLGRQAGQFSHAAIIHINDAGEISVIESLINGGVSIVPYEKWREGAHARSVVYRHRDDALAKRSADAMYARVKNSKRKILYDFKMDTSDNGEFFCTEVVREAYNLGSEGNLLLPTFPTSFETFSKHGFVKSLGVKVLDSFSPNDLEIEPNLDVVLEWRNPIKTRKVRVQDAVLESMLMWMREKDYYLYNDILKWTKVHLAQGLRKLGLLSSVVPENMTTSFFKNFVILEAVSGKLENRLMEKDHEQFKERGYSLSFKALLVELERYRREDCQQSLDYTQTQGNFETTSPKMPDFHFNFRRKDSSCPQ